MKKITILCVMAMLCLKFTGRAQEIRPLKLGQKITTAIYNQQFPLLNISLGQTDSLSLGQFKGKLILLDFWATWCSTCINKFDLLQQLQQKYASQFKVLLVNAKNTKDTPQKIEGMLNGIKAPFVKSKLVSIYNDEVLNKLFPYTYMPFYVWISAKGELLAVTGAELLTEQTLQAFLVDVPLPSQATKNTLKEN